jgi:hypothetical protein
MGLRILIPVAAAVAAGCASSGGAPSARSAAGVKAAVAAWYTGGGQDRLTALAADAHAASSSISEFDLEGLRSVCAEIQSDAEDAQAYDQIPDAALQDQWSKAVTQYADAAADCIAGVDESDGTLVQRSADELSAGAGYAGRTAEATAKLSAES